MVRIKFEVSGQMFSVSKDTMDAGPPSRLKTLCTDGASSMKKPYFIIDRPTDAFAAILTMYQTGELHMPVTSCPVAFLKELEFWEIQSEMLSSCCFYRGSSKEQRTLKKFRESIFKDQDDSIVSNGSTTASRFRTFRQKLWSVIYFAVTLIMVLLSIFTYAYSTDERFQRTMTNCERLEYMKASGMYDLDIVFNKFSLHCNEEEIPGSPDPTSTQQSNCTSSDSSSVTDGKDDDISEDFKFVYVDFDPDDKQGDNNNVNDHTDNERNDTASIHDDINITLDSTPSKPKLKLMSFLSIQKRVRVPNMKLPIFAMFVLETTTTAFFTLDIVLRLLSCPSIVRYFKSVINVADAIALIGIHVHTLVLYVNKREIYEDGWVDMLEFIQVIRFFRLFRVVKNVKASRVLVFTILNNMKDLSILILFLIVGVCTFSSIVFISEDREILESIPDGWYWALITMTTVGYGDVTPKTGVGRVMSCLCAISGVLLFAFTVPMFANHFITLYKYAGIERYNRRKTTKELCVSVESFKTEVDSVDCSKVVVPQQPKHV